MKKLIFIPFAFLGLILASCGTNKSTTKLDDKNYDLATPKCVLDDIKTNLKSESNLKVFNTFAKTSLYDDIESPTYRSGFIKYSKDGKYFIASYFKNGPIFESDNDIVINREETENDTTYGLSILAFSVTEGEAEKHYIYDSYGNKILESNNYMNISYFSFLNETNNIREHLLEYYESGEVKTVYLRYTYTKDNIKLDVTGNRLTESNENIKYNQETKVGEVSKYGYFPLKEYGEKGYYVVNDGFFAYFNDDYEYKLNFKTIFSDYKIIGKYVVSYFDNNEIDNLRDDFDYYDTNVEKHTQDYMVYDITTGKSVDIKLDNIVIDSIDKETLGYVEEENLYYFNANVIDNRSVFKNALVTVDDDLDIKSIEFMPYTIDKFNISNNIMYVIDNSKVYIFDDNFTLKTSFSYTEKIDNYYIAKNNNKYGIVDENGIIKVPFEYSSITYNNANIYYKNPYLAIKNSKYYSLNAITGQSTLLEGYVSGNFGISYIIKEDIDENNNPTYKLYLYSQGTLIDEFDTDGSTPIFSYLNNQTNNVVNVEFVDKNNNPVTKNYYRLYSFGY